MSTPILLAWSGGKDCLLALQRLLADPAWEVVGLLTTVNRNYARVAMHGVQRDVLLAQTAALGLPLVEVLLDWPGSNEAYEEAHARALADARVRWPGIRHCAFGGQCHLEFFEFLNERVLTAIRIAADRCGGPAIFCVFEHNPDTLV